MSTPSPDALPPGIIASTYPPEYRHMFAPSPDVETVREIALSLCNCINRNMPEHGPCCPTGRLLAALRGAGLPEPSGLHTDECGCKR
jgi:hypothetical protein